MRVTGTVQTWFTCTGLIFCQSCRSSDVADRKSRDPPPGARYDRPPGGWDGVLEGLGGLCKLPLLMGLSGCLLILRLQVVRDVAGLELKHLQQGSVLYIV